MNMYKCKLAKGPFKKHNKRCDWCGKKLRGRRRRWCSDSCSNLWYANHNFSAARRLVRRRDKYKCVKCGARSQLEVNHIEPVLGKHSVPGCWHHLDNLETLCHPCHLIVTKQQRLDGKFDK